MALTTKTVHLKVEDSDWAAFKASCAAGGKSISEVLSERVRSQNPARREADVSQLLKVTPSEHKHRKASVLNGGLWMCSCRATSRDNGRTWR